jgi:hypothetical protein
MGKSKEWFMEIREKQAIEFMDNLFTCADLVAPAGHEYLENLSVPMLKSLLPAYRTDVDTYIRELIQYKSYGC